MSDTASTSNELPLAGLRVLDIASFIAAPVAATVMADYGANVIKVEPPGAGDPNRSIKQIVSYPPSEVNYPWEMDSRGKRSIVIDLNEVEGQRLLYKLIAKADVLITNYPLRVREKLKVGYDHVRHLNPRLIYASFTGYGESGPDKDQLGFDSTAYFARSGLFDCNRYEGQPPGVAQPAQGDRGAGIALFGAIMLALFQRQQTGVGTYVQSSLIANGLWANGVGAQAALVGSFLPPRPPRDRPRNALTNPYRTADDRWMQLTLVLEEKGWPSFLEAIERPELADDPRFAELPVRRKNSAALVAVLDPIFASKPWSYWRDRLAQFGLPVGLIGKLSDLPTDAQARASGAVVETDIPHMPLTLAAPFSLANAKVPRAKPAPALGEHTNSVLSEIGIAPADIAELRAQKIVS